MNGLMRRKDQTPERSTKQPGPVASSWVVELAASAVGSVVGVVAGLVLAVVRLLVGLMMQFPKASVVAGSLAYAAVVGGWPLLVLVCLGWLALTWLAITLVPEAVRAALGIFPRSGYARSVLAESVVMSPGDAQARGRWFRPDPPGWCRHGMSREVCTFCGVRQQPLHRHHRVGVNPQTGDEVFVPTVEVPAGWWPQEFDNNDERNWR